MSNTAPKQHVRQHLLLDLLLCIFCLGSCEYLFSVIRDDKYLLILKLNLGLCLFNNCMHLNMQIITLNLF